MERSLRRRVKMTEEKLVRAKELQELNEQWERIVNQRVEEIRLEAEEEQVVQKHYQEVANELKVLRGMFQA